MPLGYERLNERSSRPNSHINFIKPLENASATDQQYAKTFLERIAAQCYPVMKKHHIYVQALEEFPPNKEFLGRNFNAGECIQLVLKDRAGRWLGFKFVQMVMMHELAHCKQMNHSKAFWAQRNLFAAQMEDLWKDKYMGEGMWGKGKDLTSGTIVSNDMPNNPQVPEHLCGGTYRRKGGFKRKRGQDGDKKKGTYAERQQKRLTRKFGKHGEGNALGEDELVRGALERGNRGTGKPRVAGSKRGRELRANAALARFEAAKIQQQKENAPLTPIEVADSDTESDWSADSDEDILTTTTRAQEQATLKDKKGRELVRVCGDEDEDEEGGQDELAALQELGGGQLGQRKKKVEHDSSTESEGDTGRKDATGEDAETESEPDDEVPHSNRAVPEQHEAAPIVDHPAKTNGSIGQPSAANPECVTTAQTCLVCSLENDADSVTCMACANVLKPRLMKNHWRCKNAECHGSKYINSGDVGRCGLCGGKKPTPALSHASTSSSFGVLRNDVLRWD